MRLTDMRSIEKALNFAFATRSQYPMPDDAVEIRTDSTIIRQQGELGSNAYSQLIVSDAATAWTDPTTHQSYTYVTDAARVKYQIAGFMESIARVHPLIESANAAGSTIKIVGKPLGIVFDSDTPVNKVLAIHNAGYLDIKNTTTSYTVQLGNGLQATGT